jgi:hypothetical protein
MGNRPPGAEEPATAADAVSATERRAAAVYRAFVADIAAEGAAIDRRLPAAVDPVPLSATLALPLTLWAEGEKSSRAVPLLLALEYAVDLDPEVRASVERVLVGLDVLLTMLDELIDGERLIDGSPENGPGPAGARERFSLAATLAFASLLSLGSIPHDRQDAVRDALTAYLIQASRIPSIEAGVDRWLDATADDPERLDALVDIYGRRARDGSGFAAVAGAIAGIDAATVARIEADLRTHRARSLLFDDVRDLAVDREQELRTAVRWLADHEATPETVAAWVDAVASTFDYSGADYCDGLRRLEGRPADLVEPLRRGSSS